MLLLPRDFPGKGTGVGCRFLLPGIFLTQGSKLGLLHCRQTLYRLSHQGSHLHHVHSIFCQNHLKDAWHLNPMLWKYPLVPTDPSEVYSKVCQSLCIQPTPRGHWQVALTCCYYYAHWQRVVAVSALWEWKRVYFSLGSMRDAINVPGEKSKLFLPPSLEYRCSVTKSRLTHCNSMDSSTPGSSVLHYLLEFAQSMSSDSVMLSNHLICPRFMKTTGRNYSCERICLQCRRTSVQFPGCVHLKS